MVDPHQPLRDDVRLLGELLGRTLIAHQGQQLYQTVERIRKVAKEARGGDPDAFDQLADELAAMDVDDALGVARAFTHFLALANIAEQHHRIRRRRDYRRDPAASPQRGSCDESFARLIHAGIPPAALHDAVAALRIELVFTAHPTEIARRTVVQRNNRIAAQLARHDRGDLTILEREAVMDELRREVEGAWSTRELREQRPSPLDEVRSGLIVFEQSLWRAIPDYLRELDRVLRRHTGDGLPVTAVPLRFGSWIGGDRDGNPNVTAEVTRVACLFARWTAVQLYLSEVAALREELSMAAGSAELAAAAGGASEPYRAVLRTVQRALTATREWIEAGIESPGTRPPEGVYVTEEALDATLALCQRSLLETGHDLTADGRLADLRRRVATFGMVLAPLDVRQESERHAEALSAITRDAGAGNYGDWPEDQRVAWLSDALAAGVPAWPAAIDADENVRDVLETCAMLARIPRNSLGAYVITMAHDASDVLAVEYLQRAAGVESPLRVVPLFETSRDLQNAGPVLDRLLANAWYRDRLTSTLGGRQEVMIGYSDSAKDVGRFAAGWDLHKAQEAVVSACRARGVAVTLFHGRGGSIGRGGGPTHLALMAQPPGSIDGTLRVTEQGEMLQALFGLPDIAQRTLEVYTTGTLEAWLTPAPAPPPAWRDQMERLAGDARQAYRTIVHETPEFMDYFRAATPEAELGRMNIGSRPARRQSGGGLSALRAIPWQFAWTQTRLMLGAWLGVERALGDAIRRGELERLREMHRGWAQFRSLIDLIEMVLAKADERMAAEYDRRLVPATLRPLGEELRRRLREAIDAVRRVTGHDELLEGAPVIRRSIDVRNPYVDPINLVQVDLLRRVRARDDEKTRRALLVTVNGIAAGMRNTG